MSIFKPRDIEIIQAQFFHVLASANTSLTAINTGDGIYTIGRAIAAMHSEEDLLIDEASKSNFFSTATGDTLDAKCEDIGVIRKSASPATGYCLVLASSNIQLLQKGTVLTDAFSGMQFFVTNVTSVQPFVEVRVPIVATLAGAHSNLSANTSLISPNYPDTRFIIGAARSADGTPYGDLSGGRDIESDSILYNRAINTILVRKFTTTESIKARLLEEQKITYVSVVSPLPGFIQVWVDSDRILTTDEFAVLNNLVNSIKPAGIVSTVFQITKQYVDFNIRVSQLSTTSDIDTLSTQINDVILFYFSTLEVDQSYSRSILLRRLQTLGDISFIDITLPTEQTITPQTGKLLRPRNILITHNII